MNEYPKIDTLYVRDERTHKIIVPKWRNPELEYLSRCLWDVDEKIDGTNIRIKWDGQSVSFGGRTDAAQIPANLINVLNATFTADKFAGKNPMCLYGEGCGAKIQKGGGNYKSDGVMFVLFDVLVDRWWLRSGDIEDVAREFSVDVAPRIGIMNLHDVTEFVRCGIQSTYGAFPAEGVVVRPQIPLSNRSGHRIIGKLKCKDF